MMYLWAEFAGRRHSRWRACIRRAWMPLTFLILPSAPASAQLGGEQLEVAVAALAHIRDSLPDGPAALDPELFCEARLIGWSCPPRLREVADSLDFRLSSQSFTHVCLGGPQSCRLVGVESLVVLALPEVKRNSASLEASVWWRVGSAPRPPSHRIYRLVLTRRAREWTVVREESLPSR